MKLKRNLFKILTMIFTVVMSASAVPAFSGVMESSGIKNNTSVKKANAKGDGPDLTDYFGIQRKEIIKWLEDHKDKYLGTDYPNYPERHGPGAATADWKPGKLQCTAFVWHVIWHAATIAKHPNKKRCAKSAVPEGVMATGNPNVKWYSWVKRNNIKYHEYKSKKAMFDAKILKKGDIVIQWVGGGPGTVNSYHHWGFFWGDSPTDDKYWHSSDRADPEAKANCIEGVPGKNRISIMEPKIEREKVGTYWVLQWDDDTTPEASIKVKKEDEDGNTVEGALFSATNVATGKVRKGTSREDGIATINVDKNGGTYKLKEEAAPDPFLVSDEVKTVTVKAGEHMENPTKLTTFRDKKAVGHLKLNKDITGLENGPDTTKTIDFSDTAFELRKDNASQTVVKEFTHFSANGVSEEEKNIPLGKYILHEKKAPLVKTIRNGAVISTERAKKVNDKHISFEWQGDDVPVVDPIIKKTKSYKIDANDKKTIRITDWATEVSQLHVKKVDTNNDPLEGAKYRLFKSDGTTSLEDSVTDETGTADFDTPLTSGKSYYVQEIEAPSGYVRDPVKHKFTVGNTDVTLNYTDIMVTARKTDNDHVLIDGAHMQVVDAQNNVVDEWISDSSQDGDADHPIKNLVLGNSYTLKEISAPEGYKLGTPQTFTVTGAADIHLPDFIDEKDTTVSIVKTDTYHQPIQNVVFGVYKPEANGSETELGRITTNEAGYGKLVIKDVTGIVNVRELSCPAEYVLNETPKSVNITKTGQDYMVSFVDKQVFARKLDTHGNPRPDSELQVLENNQVIDSWRTDGTDHVIKNLKMNHSYVLHESKAPDGWVRAKDVQFTVTDDETNQLVTMIDKQYFLRKVDVDGKLLDNVHAKLAVVRRGDDPKDASKVLDTWYTDDKNAIIQDGDNKGYHAVSGLEEGGQYTVYEVETPKGYVTFKPEDFDVTEEKVDQWRTVIDKRVGVTKTDIGTKTLKDAHLQVIDANNRNVICDQWVTDDSGFWWVSGLEEDHDYILVETKAPYNYVIATEIPFRVTHDSNEKKNNQFLTMKDKQVHVKKQDLGGQEVPGAKMCVIDNDDNNRVVYSWTSGNKETIVQYLREGHHYTFHEEASPDGYVVATDLKFYVNDYKINETYKVTDKRVRALKTDVNHENPIEGAKLSVIDKDSGKTVDTWRTTKDFHYVNNLIEGKTYIMREEEAPKGYVRANDVIFTVSRAKETQSVYMVDKRVKISKKGVKVDSEVEGAKMAIYKSEDGKITDDVAVDTWTTTKDPHYADGLSEGHEYTLVELRAPEGYVKAKPITFIATAASEDGIKADQLEVMIDKRFQVSKTDVTGKKEVPGAHLAVTDAKTGKLIKEWVSTTKPYYVSGLEEGRTYILSETRAPKGYAVAESVQFYITEEKVDQKCIMKDKQISVTKTDITGTKEVPGAKLEVIDKDTKKTVDQWISGSKKHYVDNLKENHDYILKETRAPKGYVKAEQVEFRVTGEKVNQKHIMKDKQVTVTKTDITGGKEVPGAHLTVTDKKTGRKVDSWISTEKPHNVSGLEEKHTYILTEKLAPKGYVKAESVEFYVSNAKINQKHLMKDKRVFITKTDITTGKELPGAHLSVTDKKTGKVVDRWVSGYHPHAVSGLKEGRRYILKEVTAPNGYLKAESIEFLVTKDKVNQKHVMKDRPYAPKTGDETDTTPYIIGAGGAVAVIAAAVIISIIRKKKKNK